MQFQLSFNVDVAKYIMLTNSLNSSDSLFTKIVAIWGSSDDNSLFPLTRLSLAYCWSILLFWLITRNSKMTDSEAQRLRFGKRCPEKRSKETLNFWKKMFKRSVLNGLEELLNKNQLFQWQSNFIRSVSHDLSKCFVCIIPVHRWQGFRTLMHSQLVLLIWMQYVKN